MKAVFITGHGGNEVVEVREGEHPARRAGEVLVRLQAATLNQVDLYRQVATAMKINVPKDPMRSSKLIDGVVWDGKDPAKYADGFKIKAV